MALYPACRKRQPNEKMNDSGSGDSSGDSASTTAKLQLANEHILLGMGNPLLDIMVQVDKAFLEKYGLKVNDAILADESHLPLFDELSKRDDVEYVPGGATQNALRVFQWFTAQPNRATFFGAIGEDKYSTILRNCALRCGVNVRYQVNPNVKTGTCAALIHDHHRSLCADLAAANTFTIDHLNVPENAKFIEKAQYYYISGFFVTVCPPAIQRVAAHAAENKKWFCMNLAAPFVPQFFSDPLNQALPYVDVLFANEEEALAYANTNQFGTTDLKEIALKICEIEKVNKSRDRLTVITQGPGEVIVSQSGEVKTFAVPPVADIVDTNGAGDAFCGGFLAALVSGEPLERRVEIACYAASVVIQHQGCTLPEQCEYRRP